MSASTRQGALFGGRRRELQEFAQRGCPGMVHGRAHSHLDSLQIQVPRLTATAKDDAQKLVYFARDFLADRSRRFFSSGESTSGSDGRSWQICALTSIGTLGLSSGPPPVPAYYIRSDISHKKGNPQFDHFQVAHPPHILTLGGLTLPYS